jgi:hypothetical protein
VRPPKITQALLQKKRDGIDLPVPESDIYSKVATTLGEAVALAKGLAAQLNTSVKTA